jgi:hypothetical protein
MIRLIAFPAAFVLTFAGLAQAQNTKGRPTPEKKDVKTEARLHFQGAQAALYSALAHAEALEALCAEKAPESYTDIALSYAKTINRDISECRTDSVKMGQTVPSIEKDEHLKATRSALDEAMKAAGKAHDAIDGHGELAPAAKDAKAHLLKAVAELVQLADSLDAKPLPAPGAKVVKDSGDR